MRALTEQIKQFKSDIKSLTSGNADGTRQIERLTNLLAKAEEQRNEKAKELAEQIRTSDELEVEQYHKTKKMEKEL